VLHLASVGIAIMLQIYLLGSFRLSHADEPLKFATLPKTLPLWAYLLLETRAVPRDQLAYTLWPDVGEAEARSNLRRHLHDLRRALPPTPADQPWLLADHHTVQWNPSAPAWIDAAAFVQAAEDPNRLAEAVSLYTGDLLPNLYDDWIFFHRERLRECFFDALLQLMHNARATHDYAQAIRYAQQLLLHDPLREDVVRELMTLRHESGDRAGALQEYGRFAQRLREELDVPPMLETSALYDTIARQSLAVAARTAANRAEPPVIVSPPQPATQSLPPNNLPAQLTTFIGREAELAAAQGLLTDATGIRLLTFTGPGGSGKTRLALEVGARLAHSQPDLFPAGIYIVWLATVNRPDLVLPTIANTLMVAESPSKATLDSLQEYLRHRRLLLILDNFEHLVEAAAPLAALLAAAPDLRLIVTSRALLHLYGEQEFPVPPLPLPAQPQQVRAEEVARYAAVALFVARSRAVNPNFVLNGQNAVAVVAICTRLDGLPLAIELAAARSKLLSPQAILARLDSALTFLADRGAVRGRTQPDHHQTLRATLDWSFELLEERKQQLLVRLGVFSGGYTLEQVEAVCDLEACGDVLDGLEALVNNSLLRQYEVDGEIYFRMLATIREYAAARLDASPEAEAVRSRHGQVYLALAQEIAPRLHGPHQAVWLPKLETAHANLRTALAWAIDHDQADLALPLATALAYFWVKGGHLAEGRQWMARVLALPAGQAATPLRAAALNAAAQNEILFTDVDYSLPAAYYRESIAISEQLGNRSTLAYAYTGLAITLDGKDDAQAQALLADSLRLFRQLGDRWGEAQALATLAQLASRAGDPARALPLFRQSVAIFQELGDRWSLVHTLILQAFSFHVDQQDLVTARQLYLEILPIAEAAEDHTIIATALVNLGDLAIAEGEYAQAEPYLRRALAHFEELGELWQPPRILRLLSVVTAWRGDEAQAQALCAESIALNRKLGDHRAVIAGLIAQAYHAHRTGRHEHAVRQLAAASAAIEQTGAQLLPADGAIRQRLLAATQAALPPPDFAAAWAAGTALAVDAALV
jgi:predicted ATPase/DNA-binding SARP family transcriptional activator